MTPVTKHIKGSAARILLKTAGDIVKSCVREAGASSVKLLVPVVDCRRAGVTVTFPSEKCFCTFQRSLRGLFIELLSIDKLHTGDHFGNEFGSIQSAPVLLGLGAELEDHG
jgi:hypothetical protein